MTDLETELRELQLQAVGNSGYNMEQIKIVKEKISDVLRDTSYVTVRKYDREQNIWIRRKRRPPIFFAEKNKRGEINHQQVVDRWKSSKRNIQHSRSLSPFLYRIIFSICSRAYTDSAH